MLLCVAVLFSSRCHPDISLSCADPASMESGSVSEEERKSGARGRSSRAHAATADFSSDSSGQVILTG